MRVRADTHPADPARIVRHSTVGADPDCVQKTGRDVVTPAIFIKPLLVELSVRGLGFRSHVWIAQTLCQVLCKIEEMIPVAHSRPVGLIQESPGVWTLDQDSRPSRVGKN